CPHDESVVTTGFSHRWSGFFPTRGFTNRLRRGPKVRPARKAPGGQNMVRRCKSWARNDEGTAVIEFSILTPVFLLMLTGMMAYGIYFGAAHSLQQLAADAARTSIAGITASERSQLVTNFISRNAAAYMLIDPDNLD